MWVEYPTVKAHLKSHLAESLSENLREEVIKKWELETLREHSLTCSQRGDPGKDLLEETWRPWAASLPRVPWVSEPQGGGRTPDAEEVLLDVSVLWLWFIRSWV